MHVSKRPQGFTLIEAVIVLALFAILAVTVVAITNPDRQSSLARNSKRFANLNVIMAAIQANTSQNDGVFQCVSGDIPAANTTMSSSASGYNIAPCLVPDFLLSMPYDPLEDGTYWKATDDYKTGYSISQDSDGNVTLSAPKAELDEIIIVPR